MSESIARRAFVQRAYALLAAVHRLPRVSAPVVRVGVSVGEHLDARDAAQLEMGATLAAEEATHSASLFGGGGVELAGTTDRGLSAVIGGGSVADCIATDEGAARNGLLFVNSVCADDILRAQRCRATTFHVVPSTAMLNDARAEARLRESSLDSERTQAVAWDPSLDRFGADTLNNRFRARFGTGMSAIAWCAWVGVKILGEASLRAQSTDARGIADYLRRDGTQFDGHKGRPLSFRPWDNQLRQPLYIVAPSTDRVSRVVAEAPAVGSADMSSRELLDRLGVSRDKSACRMAE